MTDPILDPAALDSTLRKRLRGLAHHLRPAVQVGQGGLTPAVIREIDAALESHELIKVKFLHFKEQRKELTEEIAQQCKAAHVGLIGYVAIFYRRHPDPDERKVKIGPR